MQPLTLQLRIVTGTGGFTVAWSFIAMFENLTKSVSYMVCLIWKSQGVVEGNTKWSTSCYRLGSSVKNVHFKEFRILILQYNYSLRSPWKRVHRLAQSVERLTAEREVAGLIAGTGSTLRVLKKLRNKGTAFAQQTARPSHDLDDHVKWWSCLQKET